MNTTAKRISKNKRFPARQRESGNDGGFISQLKGSALSVAMTLAFAFVTILLITAIVFPTADPARLAVPLSALLFCFFSAVCGFISSKLCRPAPISSGILSGAILEVFILTVAFIIGHKGMAIPAGIRAMLFLTVVPLSALGAFAGTMRTARKRRTTIHRR